MTFLRQVPAELTAPEALRQYAGSNLTPTGVTIEVVLREDGTFGVQSPGQPFQPLVPWRPHRFRVKEFSDGPIEFVFEDGCVTAMKQVDPAGEGTFARK